jgi:hypothetical protein
MGSSFMEMSPFLCEGQNGAYLARLLRVTESEPVARLCSWKVESKVSKNPHTIIFVRENLSNRWLSGESV